MLPSSGQYKGLSPVDNAPGGLGVPDCDGDITGIDGDVDNGDGEFIKMEAKELGEETSSLLSAEVEGESATSGD